MKRILCVSVFISTLVFSLPFDYVVSCIFFALNLHIFDQGNLLCR